MGSEKDFVVVDIETTGLHPAIHRITEISAVRFRDNKIREEFTTLVNPQCHIPLFITNLTGITDSMVKNAPYIQKVIPQFIDFLGDRTFVGHNAWFDYKFLNHNSMRYTSKSIENPVLCTCRLARRLLPDLYSKRLSVVSKYLGIQNIKAHRARGDALATTQVLEKFLAMLEEKGIKEHDEIITFQASRLPKINKI